MLSDALFTLGLLMLMVHPPKKELESLPKQRLPEEEDVGLDSADGVENAGRHNDQATLPPHVDKVRQAYNNRVTRCVFL